MSLRHALIGLLADQPASGYDLSRRFQDVLGSVWPAGHPQIYGELRKLADEGLIEVDSEGPRGRKAYRATGAGVAEVRRWLTATEADHTLRLEPLLRSAFFWLMTPEELAAHLDREAAYFQRARGQAAGSRRGQGPRRVRAQPPDAVAAGHRGGGHPHQRGARRLGRLGQRAGRHEARSQGAGRRGQSRAGIRLTAQPPMLTAFTRAGRIVTTTRDSPGWSWARRSEPYLAPTLSANT